MTSESKEHLSSLMDGELSRETGLFMARRLSSDAELSETWRRYHLIRDCIRRPGIQAAVVDLSQRLREQLDQEPAEAAAAQRPSRWLRPVAGLAVAASVALMAVTLVGPAQVPAPGADAPDAARGTASFTSPNTLPALPASQPVSYSVEDRETLRRLNSYLLRHNQMSGSTGRQGFVSFVPIISTQATEASGEAPEEPAAPAGGQDNAVRP